MAAPHPTSIALTGATGFVGRHLARALLDAGHAVKALVRSREKALRVLPEDARLSVVVGDVGQAESVSSLMRGVDACINLIGIIREAPGGQTFDRMHPGATRTLVRACEESGVGRFLQMSALGAGPGGPSAYQRTKFEAERIVLASGLAWTIIRPGLIVGADGEFFGQMRAWCEGRAAPYLFLPYFTRIEVDGVPGPLNPPRLVAPTVAPVDVDDVAAAFVAALRSPGSVGEVIPISGPEKMTWPQMLRATRDALPQGKSELRAIGLPGRVAALKARAAKAIGLGNLLPFDEGMALMGERDSWAPLDKAAALLGFGPRGYRASLASIVDATAR